MVHHCSCNPHTFTVGMHCTGVKLVYTPEKSESAYILAAMAVRQAAIQTAIWVGHVSCSASSVLLARVAG
jgi:hypothetical protein